jgi:hypothetical protein
MVLSKKLQNRYIFYEKQTLTTLLIIWLSSG